MNKAKKQQGIVKSDKMDKTVIVEVVKYKKHKIYHKRYKVKKRYKVHDPENKFKIGDNVKFVACRPISKDKKWKVI